MEKMREPTDEEQCFEVDQHILDASDGDESIAGKNYCDVEGVGLCVNFDLDTLLDDSAAMRKFVKLARELKNAPCRSDISSNFHMSYKEIKLLKAISQVYDFYDLLTDKLEFHPYLDAVMSLKNQSLRYLSEFSHLCVSPPRKGVRLDAMTYAKWSCILKDYFATIRSADVTRRIDYIGKLVRENRISIWDHFCTLIEKHATLLVVRIDLGYQARLKDSGRLSSIQLSEAIGDREDFLGAVKKSYPDCLGYVWKLEFAPKKGYHYHCIFYFNGEALRADGPISLALASLWKDVTGERRGVCFLCNLHKEKYTHPAIGAIHYSDKEKIKNFRFVVDYLSKNDLFSSAKTDGRRTMGKSQVAPVTKKRGRPRKGSANKIK